MGPMMLAVLILLLVGVLPAWPYSRRWGYGPTSVLGLMALILLVLLVFDVVPRGF